VTQQTLIVSAVVGNKA